MFCCDVAYIIRCNGRECYLTRIDLPARMLLPLMPFSFLSFDTVVWLRAAISESVSPDFMLTLFVLVRFFLREERRELFDFL